MICDDVFSKLGKNRGDINFVKVWTAGDAEDVIMNVLHLNTHTGNIVKQLFSSMKIHSVMIMSQK